VRKRIRVFAVFDGMAAPAPPASATPGPAPSSARAPRRMRRPGGKRLKWIIAAIILAAAAIAGFRYWHEASLYESTDNAYVGANQVEVTAQITGTVTKVYVRDQQHVKAGDPLFDIDPANYALAVQRARAQLELARQSTRQESAGVASAEAVLAQRRAEEANARSTWQRNQQLMKSGFLSPQGAEQSRTALMTAEAATRAAEAGVAQARSALGSTGDENANVQAAAAALAQAELDLQRTKVVASTDGVIANFNLQPGNVVQPGVPLFVVVASQEFWVDANFKETQLKTIRAGQHATITTDMYPDHPFEGVVQSVAGGSGSAFSLLPPQNATGNWVKVTQRVPVRIRVENPDPQHPLRIGTSATVKVRKE
jgi:membrane fusion protein (multidrug efflux system)